MKEGNQGPAVQGATSGGLSAANAVQLINRERAVVIDVCEAEEFAAGFSTRPPCFAMTGLSQRQSRLQPRSSRKPHERVEAASSAAMRAC